MRRSAHLGWLVPLALVGAVAVLRPWTVRPLDETGAAVVGPPRFDGAAYVETTWRERAPAQLAAARPVAEATTTAQFLRGEGVVVDVDTTSRVGVARVDLAPGDGQADVVLQIGPVIPGTALRDALKIGFSEFNTQVDYADVGARLNARVLAAMPDVSALEGKKVTFVGAGATGPDGLVRVTPVQLDAAP